MLVLLPVVVAGPLLVGLVAEWSTGRDRREFAMHELEVELERVSLPLEARLSHLAVSVDAFAQHYDPESDVDGSTRENVEVPEDSFVAEARLLLAQWPEVIEVYRLQDRRTGRMYSQVRRDWRRDRILRRGSGPAWVCEGAAGIGTASPAPVRFRWADHEGRPVMWCARTVKRELDQVEEAHPLRIGVLVDPARLPLAPALRNEGGARWFGIFTGDGRLLASTVLGSPEETATLDPSALESHDWSAEAPPGEEWVVQSERSEVAGWRTALVTHRQELAGGLWRNSLAMIGIALLAALSSALFIGHLVGRVSRPLDRLGRAMRQVAAGDLQPRLEIRGSDEMTHLARSFNSMVTDLHTTHEAMTLQRQALSQALREAESVERMKDDFLALVSHEVRTPLTTILGGIEFLLESFRDRQAETEVEFMSMVQQSAQRLGDFMNDAILMANLQAKGGEQGFEEFSLQAMVEMELERIRGRIADMHLDLRQPIVDREEVFVDGDWTLFQVAIQKLLDNACRHNRPEGRLVVDVVDRVLEDDTSLDDLMAARGLRLRSRDHRWYALRVMNSGPCLSAEEIPALFRRFELSHDIDHHQRGSGLSLPIVSSIVDYHGGSLQARAVDAEGMAFYVVLSGRGSGQVRAWPPSADEDGIDDVVRMARQLGAVTSGAVEGSGTAVPR